MLISLCLLYAEPYLLNFPQKIRKKSKVQYCLKLVNQNIAV